MYINRPSSEGRFFHIFCKISVINTILTSPYKSNIIDVVQFEKGVIIMNKRIDKKKQKRTLESAVTATATSSAQATATPVVEIKEVVKEVKVPVEVPAKNPAFYVQYQSAEYTVAAITERVIADCNAKGHAVETPEALSIYLKPEDKKAYYTLGGFNGYIEL